MGPYYLPQASTFAGDIDTLIWVIFGLVGFWLILAEAVFFYFIWKFRAQGDRKAEYITGNQKHEKKWINTAHSLVLICDVFIIVGSVRVWYDIKLDLPEDNVTEVRVVAQQWAWSFQHAGADGVLETADDIYTVETLHVEVDKTYVFRLESRDVMHSFSIPAFRLKQDAIPGRIISGWFEPNKTGEYDLQCAEMCGIAHGIMGARVIVSDTAGHQAWIAENTPVAALGAQ